MALKKNWIRAFSLSFFRDQNSREEKRRGEEEEEEEEEKRKRRKEEKKSKKVWNYELLYGILKFCMDFHAIVWIVTCPQT